MMTYLEVHDDYDYDYGDDGDKGKRE